MTIPNTLRAAFYARFSSDLQKDASIDRQFADLEKAAPRWGLTYQPKHFFSDYAESATSLHNRPGLTRDLLNAARAGEFDVVFVEQTDRLSRNRADLFWLADRLKYFNVKIFTIPNGEVTSLQLTFDGHMNEDFIEKLRYRVKSGHNLMTERGKVAGPAPYGYDNVLGQPGVKVINEAEAEIVRYIFMSYASGMTPRQIVKALQDRGIPSPSGAAVWNYQGILGGSNTSTGRGMLHNEIYIGKLIRNRTKRVRNHETNKYIHRIAPAEDVITVDVPELRIVSDQMWAMAHAMRLKRAQQMNPGGTKQRTTLARKPQLLAGLMRCASCSGTMSVMSSALGGRVACSNATYRKTCDHVKSYHVGTITDEVIKKIDAELTNPDFLKERMKAKALEQAKTERNAGDERKELQKKLDSLNLSISRLTTAIESTDTPVEEIMKLIQAKDAERRSIKERLRLIGDENKVTTLHPASVAAFGRTVERLCSLARLNPEDPGVRMAIANLLDCVVIHPTAKKAPYELSLYARLSAISSADLFHPERPAGEITAEEKISSGNPVTSLLSVLNKNNEVFLIGNWTISDRKAA